MYVLAYHTADKNHAEVCKPSSLDFFVFFVFHKNWNDKDTTHPLGRRLDTTLDIYQNVSQACQPEFLKIWRMQIFLFKKSGDFSLNRDILKLQTKIGLQFVSLLFESVSSSIEVFWSASDLLCA